MNIREAILRDMWKRQGVDTSRIPPDNAFWKYALGVAMFEGRTIIPQPSPDGSFENHTDATFVTAYTIPPLWTVRGEWLIAEGLPPL